MNKPYITLGVMIIEIIGQLLTIAALIVSIISKEEVVLSVSMLATNIILVLSLHFMPANLWNMPVKVTEHNALMVYKDTAYMMAIMLLIFGLFTMLCVIPLGNKEVRTNIASTAVVLALFANIVACIIKVTRDAKY